MKKLNRQLWLLVYYRQLHASTTSTITAVLNLVELITQIRRALYPWRTTQIAGDPLKTWEAATAVGKHFIK